MPTMDASTQTWGSDASTFASFLWPAQSGLRMREYYQPSAVEFPEKLHALQARASDPNPAIPHPQGWWLLMAGKGKKQVSLQLDTPSAKRFRNVFGYIAFMKPAESRGTPTPLCAQATLELPFKYNGSP